MKISKILHRNEFRYRIEFPFNNEIASKLKQIPGTRWSKNLKSWHIPYTNEAFNQFNSLFPFAEPDISINENNISTHHPYPMDCIYEANKTVFTANDKLENSAVDAYKNIVNNEKCSTKLLCKNQEISIRLTTKNMIIKGLKNEDDIAYIRSFKYTCWNNENANWFIPNFGNNFEKIKKYFENRLTIITNDLNAIKH